MTVELKNARLLFIDDERAAVKQYMMHLESEGFTNIIHRKDVSSLNEVLELKADLIFLDITGVASSLDARDEGLAILSYIKKHAPWTAVIVLSGSDFPASKANSLSTADQCVTKASLSLAQLVNLTEQHLSRALSPEYRNVQICNIIDERIDELALGRLKRWQLRRLIKSARRHEGDPSFNWAKLVRNVQKTLSTASNIASVVSLFVA